MYKRYGRKNVPNRKAEQFLEVYPKMAREYHLNSTRNKSWLSTLKSVVGNLFQPLVMSENVPIESFTGFMDVGGHFFFIHILFTSRFLH